jgi:predicted outer membrane protein
MNTLLIILFTMLATALVLIRLQNYVEQSLDKSFKPLEKTKGFDENYFEQLLKVHSPENKEEYEILRKRCEY